MNGMGDALVAWWANPVTAGLVTAVAFVLLEVGLAGLVAVVRLGAIQLGGLLAQHPRLLPGYPRRGDAYGTLILFLLMGVGLVLGLFSLALVRTVRLSGLGLLEALVILLAAWLLALGTALVAIHGSRVEPYAIFILVSLRPLTPFLVRMAEQGEEDEEIAEDEDEEVDEHDVQAFIGAGEEAGILEREDAILIASIVELGDTVAREIMTPRTDIVAVPLTAEFTTVEKQFAESMFTRLPVYRETLDRIEGVVHVKLVLRALAAGSRPTVAELMRPVPVVPETKPLRELLREFQSTRQQLAVVVDEYGGTSGIVTLEDVLEEIVGEIQDEHDRETPEVEEAGDGVYLVAGSAHVDVLKELFGVEVEEAGFDSVAGLVLERLGHLPKPGETVVWRGLELRTMEVERRRLRRVRVSRTAGREA